MDNNLKLKNSDLGDVVFGFELIKIEDVPSKQATLYTLRHKKSGAQLLYFDRADENKTFAISFKTLPEDHTGVFHILEHSVLGGSEKFPVKEPFVSLLQSSLQTFLNAMTFSDKTVYPVSSRNEKDFFNLTAVYLDGVFNPMIYKNPSIFMQEGWHYEFESPEAEPYYNGVVYSEMKGAFAGVDTIIESETNRLLFPDNSYGFESGGHPDYITDLTYEQFINTHKRFYHPSNAKIILDGKMDIDSMLNYIDGEYLSKYDSRENDFDFTEQTPKALEKTVSYAAREGEEDLSHMVISKIICRFDDTEKIYASKILADYLTGSNEAPLKRAFLENGLAQDVSFFVTDGVFQPYMSFVVRNTNKNSFEKIKSFLPETVNAISAKGLDKKALSASIERMAFTNREVMEPYGLNLAFKTLDSWLYDGNPLAHIENDGIFDSLRKKADEGYFEKLLLELLGSAEENSCLYILPSLTKGEEDEKREAEKLSKAIGTWDENKYAEELQAFVRMAEWQQSMDTEETLTTLPHLDLSDIPEEAAKTETAHKTIAGRDVMEVRTNTNGIVYLNLYFDVSDLSLDELRLLSVLTGAFTELGTKNYSAEELQTEIKLKLGSISAKTEVLSKRGDTENCTPYFVVSVSMLEEKADDALALISEILINGKCDEAGRLYDILLQLDYFLKQDLVGDGHLFAVGKALSAFSKESALKEQLEGESFISWFSPFVEGFAENGGEVVGRIGEARRKAFARNRLFVGYSGNLSEKNLNDFISSLPETEINPASDIKGFDSDNCAVEIPSGVSYSALGHNLYALGGEYKGDCAVLSHLVTYVYLWNAVRVQGGAYGTGMSVRTNGDIFCYSYRDPNLMNTMEACSHIPDFLEDFLAQGMMLDDIIIGAVNTTDPLMDPAGICTDACSKYLRGITYEMLVKTRKEILGTTPESLAKLVPLLRKYVAEAKFCAVGDKTSVEFLTK